MSSIGQAVFNQEELEEVLLNKISARDKLSRGHTLGKRPPADSTPIGIIDRDFTVLQEDNGLTINYYVVMNSTGKTVISLETVPFHGNENSLHIDTVVAGPSSPGVDRLYRFLVLKQNKTLISDSQSAGARKVWMTAVNHPGIIVYGFNTKTGKAQPLRPSDDESYANWNDDWGWIDDRDRSTSEKDTEQYNKEIADIHDIQHTAIVMQKRDRNIKMENRNFTMSNILKGITKENSIMKGLQVDEEIRDGEFVLYIDGKAATHYQRQVDAEKDAAHLKSKFPGRKFEVKQFTNTPAPAVPAAPVAKPQVKEPEELPAPKPTEHKDIQKMRYAIKHGAAVPPNFKHKDVKEDIDESSPMTKRWIDPKTMNAIHQLQSYEREVAALNKSKEAEKNASAPLSRKETPTTSSRGSVALGVLTIPEKTVEDWASGRDQKKAEDFILKKFAAKQTSEFKKELANDPDFQEVVNDFFDMAARKLEYRNSFYRKYGYYDQKKNEKERLDGYAIVDRINDVVIKHMQKHGVDKNGLRVPPGFKYRVDEGVLVPGGHDAEDPEVAVLGGAGVYKLSALKRKAQQEAEQLANDVASGTNGGFKGAAYNIKQFENTLKTIVAAEEEMKKRYFGEDYTGEFAAEKTPAVNPYGGLKDNQFRSAIGEGIATSPRHWGRLGFDTRSTQLWPEMLFETMESGVEFNNWLNKYRASLPTPAKGDSCVLAMIIFTGESFWIKHGEAIYIGENNTDYKLAIETGEHLYDKRNQIVFDSDDSFQKFLTVLRLKFSEYKIEEFAGKVEETKESKLRTESPDTSGPVGTQPGGWRRTGAKEGQIYSTGGGAGESQRKFRPKKAGSFKR